ncbi:ABC transporter ATP-binding protein [Candidatus Pacearchaeota archaeon]|nr:ABC transporter ATP-binding protein [Candidatus Pacearchaeota archaeon]
MKRYKNYILNILATEWHYLKSWKKGFVIYVILFAIAGIVTLMTPLVIGLIFNSIQQSIVSKQELNQLIFKIFLLLAITLGFWMFHGLGRVLEQRAGFLVKRNYTNDKINKTLELPISWHKDHHSGDTIDKINRGSGAISEFSSHITFQIISAIINLFGSLIILFFIDFKSAIFAFLFSSFVLFIISRFDNNLNKKYQELNNFGNKSSATIFDYLSNIFTVKTLRLNKTVSAEIDNKLMASYPTYKKSVVLNESKWAFASIMISLMTVLVLSYRAYAEFTSTGIILIGTLYMIYGYLSNVGNTFYTFAWLYGDIVRNNASIVSTNPIDEAYEKIEPDNYGRLPDNWNEVMLKNVSFTYDKEGKIVHLDNINFHFKKGEKIALVGESGSGKSTILALIRGLYSPENGEVYCDGKLLRNGFVDLKRHVTLIPQHPEIFNNTIRYNITMDLPAKEEDLKEVIFMSQLNAVISRLEKGLETNVMEKGVSLSGGEKQRLALARGLLAAKNSDIVLLDEPTSSVDSINEMKIHDQVFERFKDKTIISSIHRLHLLDKFDYIYLFLEGRIIAEGSLNELKRNPVFSAIWRKYMRSSFAEKHSK